MPYLHVHNPTQGIDASRPPFFIDPPEGIGSRATDYAKGVVIRNGEVRSEFGHVQFPTAGLTATNYLHGSVMLGKQFKKTDGSTHTLALTTTNAYHYNTSTTTWDCVTLGKLMDDCESAWTASTNVTASNDASIKLRGSTSVKLAFASGFTTGLAGYRNQSSTDYTGNTALHFWIYSSVALSSADYLVRVSEQNACGTGATYVDFNIPTIAVNTWTPCCVDGDFSNLDAVLSVGIVGVVDKGVHNLYIDDIRAVVRFTGDEDNRFSVAQYNDVDIITNGLDKPQKYDGVLATGLQLLTTTLNTGAITTSEIVLVVKDHVVFMNNTENGTYVPQRVSWGNIGELEDYIGGTAGYQDLVDDPDWIISAVPMYDDTVIIYKENSIVHMTWIGGQTPFRFKTFHQGDGSAGKDCVVSVGGEHAIIGSRYLYYYGGQGTVTQIDNKFNKSFYSSINTLYINRSMAIYDQGNSEVQFWIPTVSSIPDDIWVINTVDSEHPWYRRSRTMSGFGFTTTQQSPTIGDLIGTIGEQNYRIGDLLSRSNLYFLFFGDNNGRVYKVSTDTYNNDGVAITNEFQTPDFIPPFDDPDHPGQGSVGDYFRTRQFLYEAKGDSVTTEYSEDGGNSWNPTQGNGTNVQTLTSQYTVYQQDYDKTVHKIRWRFRNTTASSGFFIRYYGFNYLGRSSR